ncbi:MAG TPA: flagellar export chaperone FlgN [Anaeromyxobacter sp.]|nr:flagellar export chaperone FlgN [Anaeromyxobacter sp.]
MLEEALATTVELRRALEAEVERARAEREALKSLDSDRIFASAAARAAFNAEVAQLESQLAAALRRAAGRVGAAEVTLAALAARSPGETAALTRALADVRALAAALAELDRLNLLIAGRAMACVQAYLNALQPAPSAYDRRGIRTAASRSGTTWSKV